MRHGFPAPAVLAACLALALPVGCGAAAEEPVHSMICNPLRPYCLRPARGSFDPAVARGAPPATRARDRIEMQREQPRH